MADPAGELGPQGGHPGAEVGADALSGDDQVDAQGGAELGQPQEVGGNLRVLRPLGHPEEGRRLAQAGRAGLSRTPESAACLADLWALEGRALAKLGDKKAAVQAVSASEHAFSNVAPGNEDEPEWACFIDPAYLNGEHATTFQDIGESAQAETYARLSIDHARAQRRARRGAMSQAALAVSHLHRRDLEAAHAAGLRTLNLSRQVQSSRAVEAVQNLQRQMVPFGRHALVADFNERARGTGRVAATPTRGAS